MSPITSNIKNLGAIDDQDTGFGIDISLGRACKADGWRFTFGYWQTNVDAVQAAFSSDNLHALTLDYTPMPKTMISAIWYQYKPNDPLYAGTNQPDDLLDRFRLFFPNELLNYARTTSTGYGGCPLWAADSIGRKRT